MSERPMMQRRKIFLLIVLGISGGFILGIEEFVSSDSWVNQTGYIMPNDSWNQNVNISGNLTVRGQNAQFSQNLNVFGMINSTSYVCSGSPSITNLSGAGVGPTISITGTDCSGTINLTTGTLPVLSANIFQVTFGNPRKNTLYAAILFPANANTQTLNGVNMVGSDIQNTTAWTIQSGTSALTASTSYAWRYQVIG